MIKPRLATLGLVQKFEQSQSKCSLQCEYAHGEQRDASCLQKLMLDKMESQFLISTMNDAMGNICRTACGNAPSSQDVAVCMLHTAHLVVLKCF